MSSRSKDEVSRSDAGDGCVYLPWVDCITAGVPCQDVSVAGKRAGLKGERTGLFYEFARILRELRPTWFVFENVPGLLRSNRGRDFAEVLRVLMVECGYGVSWRVLDSQYFGVAQRRQRLFVVGCFGRPCPGEVLFEPESLSRRDPPSRSQATDIAVPLTSGAGVCGKPSGRRMEDDFNLAVCEAAEGHLVAKPFCAEGSRWRGEDHDTYVVAATLNSGGNNGGFRTEPGEHIVAVRTAQTGANGIGVLDDGTCHTLDGSGADAVLVLGRQRGNGHAGLLHAGEGSDDARETALSLRADPGGIGQGHNTNFIVSSAPDPDGMRDIARLLPQGLDSARYRALGNAVTTKVTRWIAERILAAERRE